MIGRKLSDRYQLEDMIGEGATAIVYRATDLRLRRTVAVKMLLPHSHSATKQRFWRRRWRLLS
ncbi:MAG: hypothetical protein U0528_07345 [Anaerolineae bacterium]